MSYNLNPKLHIIEVMRDLRIPIWYTFKHAFHENYYMTFILKIIEYRCLVFVRDVFCQYFFIINLGYVYVLNRQFFIFKEKLIFDIGLIFRKYYL